MIRLTALMRIALGFACWMPQVIGIIYACQAWFSPEASAAEQQRWSDFGGAIQTIEPPAGTRLQPSYAAG